MQAFWCMYYRDLSRILKFLLAASRSHQTWADMRHVTQTQLVCGNKTDTFYDSYDHHMFNNWKHHKHEGKEGSKKKISFFKPGQSKDKKSEEKIEVDAMIVRSYVSYKFKFRIYIRAYQIYIDIICQLIWCHMFFINLTSFYLLYYTI